MKPVSPEEYAADAGDTPLPVLNDAALAADGYATGLDVWAQVAKAYEWYLSRDDHPDGLDNAQMWSLQEAIKADARRGDPVEQWIMRMRERYAPYNHYGTALDDLLADYRLHADTGTPTGH